MEITIIIEFGLLIIMSIISIRQFLHIKKYKKAISQNNKFMYKKGLL